MFFQWIQTKIKGKKWNICILVQSLSHVWLFVTQWTAARQISLSITNSWILLKLISIESVIPSHPLSSPYPPALNLPQRQSLLLWTSSSHQVAKILEFQLQHHWKDWCWHWNSNTVHLMRGNDPLEKTLMLRKIDIW